MTPETRQRIAQWPTHEQPRERLRTFGESACSDAQLLAILLRTGDGTNDPVTLARSLVHEFGGLGPLAEASIDELMEVKGLGLAKAAVIRAAFALGHRVGHAEGANRPIFDAGDVVAVYGEEMAALPHEVLRLLVLDAKNVLVRHRDVASGGLFGRNVRPADAFYHAVRERAASVIFVHNHPSGDPTPSRDDRDLTRTLCETGALLDIPVLDHIIIARGGHTSFKDEGWL
ncbi:DNA repair protein RadC [Nitrospinae bacterium AH_259_B05_G02_I21]|nr:DNA repair protein RadC [Nitrospinae bacterium AH_259_B05_G02_I21]MDA2932382.1 DNA repair protein RadC [Nitrospinae bacterium AH-259-F20]